MEQTWMCEVSSQPAVFTPEAVAAINRAYAEAVDIIGPVEGHEALRLDLAEHMMLLARNGELNEERLCSLSVLAILGRRPDRGQGGARRLRAI